MAAINRRGRVYEQGKSLHNAFRQEILDRYNNGHSKNRIGRDLLVSTSCVRKVIGHYQQYGTVIPFSRGGSDPRKVTDNILNCVEIWKLQKPSMYTSEIQNKLLQEGVCNRGNLPATSSINRALREKLSFTRKRICQVPREQENTTWKVDEFLEATYGLLPTSLHFFDEASVIKTTSNRTYGSSYRGTPAIEIQRYASNATYTVNLLHSALGVDYYNILPGASNGEELVAFFDYALDCRRDNGLPVFLEGDTVIMDNCGFHHGRITEGAVRQMLATRGVTLLFQPPYSPHLNTCEYCFHQMKQELRKNEHYSQEYTEMAIIDAVNGITASQSQNYFRHCGYLYQF